MYRTRDGKAVKRGDPVCWVLCADGDDGREQTVGRTLGNGDQLERPRIGKDDTFRFPDFE